MKILLKDGIKYFPYKYKNEEELEQVVLEHSEILFGKGSVFFSKQKIKTISGIGTIPDGFLLELKEKKWYIVEVELSSHPIYEHIIVQINKFKTAMGNLNNRKKLAKAFREELEEKGIQLEVKEKYEFLSDLVDENPEIIVVIDRKSRELEDACGNLLFPTTILESKTYCRESVGMGVHIHLFDVLKSSQMIRVALPEGEWKPEKSLKVKKRKLRKITPQKEYRAPILESLIEMGSSGRVKEILDRVQRKMAKRLTSMDREELPSGKSIRWRNAAQFERQKMKENGLLKSNSPMGIWEITKEGEKYHHSQKIPK